MLEKQSALLSTELYYTVNNLEAAGKGSLLYLFQWDCAEALCKVPLKQTTGQQPCFADCSQIIDESNTNKPAKGTFRFNHLFRRGSEQKENNLHLFYCSAELLDTQHTYTPKGKKETKGVCLFFCKNVDQYTETASRSLASLSSSIQKHFAV